MSDGDFDDYEPPAHRNIVWGRVAILIAIFLAIWLAAKAMAHEPPVNIAMCADAAELRKAALTKYGELEAGIGISSNGHLVQLLLDPNDTSWTIIQIMGGGRACIIAAGEKWEFAPIGELL